MRFEIENGNYLGTAEWAGPGDVVLDMPEGDEKKWLQQYFSEESVYLGGTVDCPEMIVERRDSSEAAFTHAVFELDKWACSVRVVEPAGASSRAQGNGGA